MRVLLVEDDVTATRGMTLFLRSRNLVVDTTDTGEEALGLLKHYDYDLVLLDLMLPDMDGYEVIRSLRAARQKTPVVILSGVTRPEAKVKAFDLGADDYVAKPCATDELMARILAVVRRNKGYCNPILEAGPLKLNLDARDVSVNGTPVLLSGKEYAVLELLVLRKGKIQSKEGFLNHLYGGIDEPEIKIIDVFVCKLRKKLALAGAGGMIETVWNRGYMLRTPPSDATFAACVAAGAIASHPARPISAASRTVAQAGTALAVA